MRVLVVEDDPDIRELLVELFRDDGYIADSAGCVAEAEYALSRCRYDLLILDILLPDGNGRSLLRKLRRIGNTVPVVVCSGRPDIARRAAIFDEGADVVLEKPFSCTELSAWARALMRRSHRAAPYRMAWVS